MNKQAILEKLQELAIGTTVVYLRGKERIEVTCAVKQTLYFWRERQADAETVANALAAEGVTYFGAYSPAR